MLLVLTKFGFNNATYEFNFTGKLTLYSMQAELVSYLFVCWLL